MSPCGRSCIFVDRPLSCGRIRIFVDDSVSLWTVLYLVDGSVSLETVSLLFSIIKVPVWTILFQHSSVIFFRVFCNEIFSRDVGPRLSLSLQTTTVTVSLNHCSFIISFQESEWPPAQHKADERSYIRNSHVEIK